MIYLEFGNCYLIIVIIVIWHFIHFFTIFGIESVRVCPVSANQLRMMWVLAWCMMPLTTEQNFNTTIKNTQPPKQDVINLSTRTINCPMPLIVVDNNFAIKQKLCSLFLSALPSASFMLWLAVLDYILSINEGILGNT